MKTIVSIMTILASIFFMAACDVETEEEPADVSVDVETSSRFGEVQIVPSDTVTEGTNVRLEAPEVFGHRFEHWEDRNTGEIMSTTEIFRFEAREDVALRAVYIRDMERHQDRSQPSYDLDGNDHPLAPRYPDSHIIFYEDTIYQIDIHYIVFDDKASIIDFYEDVYEDWTLTYQEDTHIFSATSPGGGHSVDLYITESPVHSPAYVVIVSIRE